MVDDKDDKLGGEDAFINDSGELLKSLFREELNAIAAEKKKIVSAQTGDKSTAPKRAKSPSQDKGEGRKKVGPKTGTEKRAIVKNYPVSGDQVEKPKRFASDIDTSLDKGVGEKSEPGIKEDIPGELIPEEGIKRKQLKGGKVRSGGNLPPASGKLKVALLSVLLVAAVAFMLGSLGVVDYGKLLGLTEPPKKAGRKTRAAKRPPAPPISEKRPPTKHPTPETPDEKSVVVKETPEPVTSTAPETPLEKTVSVSEQPEAMPSKQEPAAEKTPPQTASLKLPAREIQPPKWVEGVYPFSVYLGSFRTPERLQKAVTECGSMGLSPYWVQVDLGKKGRWFRLFAGFFRTRGEADAFIRENKIPSAASRHTKYAVLIGTYTSEKELNAKRMELRALGCSSYEVKNRHGVFGLFTGAFYRKARAKREHAELASKGIRSQIVER